jgi:hypothetical protein
MEALGTFWPTIKNERDVDDVTRHGLWLCFIIAGLTFIFGLSASSWVIALLDGLFFLLAGVGVRERSISAAVVAFLAFLLGTLARVRSFTYAINIGQILILALLFANIRAIWLMMSWAKEPEFQSTRMRRERVFAEKVVNQMPSSVWPKSRFAFYVLAIGDVLLRLYLLFAAIPQAGS